MFDFAHIETVKTNAFVRVHVQAGARVCMCVSVFACYNLRNYENVSQYIVNSERPLG